MAEAYYTEFFLQPPKKKFNAGILFNGIQGLQSQRIQLNDHDLLEKDKKISELTEKIKVLQAELVKLRKESENFAKNEKENTVFLNNRKPFAELTATSKQRKKNQIKKWIKEEIAENLPKEWILLKVCAKLTHKNMILYLKLILFASCFHSDYISSWY